MSEIFWVGLIANAALLLSLGLLYDVAAPYKKSSGALQQIAAGMVIGGISVVLMIAHVHWGSGVIFDTRTILLGLAGLYFGTLPTLVAVCIAGLYRLSLGGDGVVMGIATIISSGVIGIAWRHYRYREAREFSLAEVYAFGCAVHIVMILCMFLLPSNLVRQTLRELALPVIVLYPACTALLGNLLSSRQRRLRLDIALAHDKALFEAIFNGIPDAIVYADVDRNIVAINSAFTSIFGFEISEIRGRKTAYFYESEAEYARQGQIRFNLSASEQRLPYVVNYRKKDGSVFPGETLGTTIRSSGGEVLGYIGVIRDISQRNETEKQVRRLGNLYAALSQCNKAVIQSTSDRELFEQVCAAIVTYGGMKMAWIGVVDNATQILVPIASSGEHLDYLDGLEVSVDINKPTGRGPGGMSVRENRAVWSPDFLSDERTAVWHEMARRTGWRSGGAVPLRRGGVVVGALSIYSSETYPFDEATRKLLTEMTDNVSYALDAFVSKAQREKAQNDLRESNQRLLALFQASPIGIVVSSLDDGKIIDVNAAALQLYGYTRDEVIGRTVAELNTYADPNQRQQLLALLREHGSVDRFQITYKTKDGILGTIEASCRIIELKGESCLLEMTVDIGQRLKAEKENAALQAQVQQAQKMESVGRLAGGVAHDFNNMLTVINGNTELALAGVSPGSDLHTELSEIRNAARRSADLTRQLLAFARKQTISPKVMDLNEAVQGMLKMLQRLIGESIEMHWVPGANLWPVKMDPSQMDQILVNLCINSRDAIQGVGKVVIETENCILDEAYCANRPGFYPGEFVRLAVSDNGHGIDEHILPNIFEPFFTTKRPGRGTGLGLATIYGAVKQNDGFINVYSEVDSGTTFTIYLPRLPDDGVLSVTVEETRVSAGGAETILLLEDEASILHMTTRILERQGYTVLQARTPGDAVRITRERKGALDLLLTDVVMPEMNGVELAANLNSAYPNLKVLFMSGYTSNIIVHQGVIKPGVNFIQKPFSIDDLAKKVRDVLDAE